MEKPINDTQNKNDEKVVLMAVAFDAKNDMYTVDLARGSNVAETAFAMTVVIKCLLKDGIIEKATDVTDLISKYMSDPQYDELKPEDAEEVDNGNEV